MRNLPLLFCGIFFALAASWCGVVMSSNVQYGALQPIAVEEGGPVNPQQISGIAQQGRQVYTQMGCIYCHTQQVRPSSSGIPLAGWMDNLDQKSLQTLYLNGPDIARGWGKRGTVPRDYIYQSRVLLGSERIGPDLADVGERAVGSYGAAWQYLHLYDPQLTEPGSVMPPYRFLFRTQKIGDEPSPLALKFPAGAGPADGYEIVPTDRAAELVAYLQSLKIDYELPEAHFGPNKDL